MWNTPELAYLAGIIDGEGCITALWNRRSSQYIGHVGVTTTDLVLADWLVAHFGGTVYARRPQRGFENRKPKYEWVIYQRRIDELFPQIAQFLVIKDKHAAAMLAFRATFSKKHKVLSPEVVAERERCYHVIRSLNAQRTTR